MSIATKKEILKVLESIDVEQLIDRMHLYTVNRFYSNNEKSREGLDYSDFVYGVFDKSLQGIRNWNKKYSFEEFVFGVLRSEINEFFRKKKNKEPIVLNDIDSSVIEIPEFIDINNQFEYQKENIDFNTISKQIIEDLIIQGADDLEILIFECWLEDIYKPQEIAKFLEISVPKTNVAIKRLKRRRTKIQKKWMILKKK